MAATLHPTRYPELGYRKDAPDCWRFVDRSTDASVGLQYPTKSELLADLDRYAAVFGVAGSDDPQSELRACVRALLTCAARYDTQALTESLRSAVLTLPPAQPMKLLLSLKVAVERAAVTARHQAIAALAPKLRRLSFDLEYERGVDDVYYPDILSMTMVGENEAQAVFSRPNSEEELQALEALIGVRFTETLSAHGFIEQLEELCIAFYIDCGRDEIAFGRE